MFDLTTTVRTPQQALAMLLAVAVLVWSVGAYTTAQAANLVELSNTLTDSAPEAQAGHSIEFTVPDGSDIDGDITIDFPSEFTDVDAVADGNTTVTGGSGTASVTAAGDTVTISGITAAAQETITIVIDDGVVTNPALTGSDSESFEFTVTTQTTEDGDDVGNTRVVIIDTVQVTAIVETIFEFVIDGVADSETVNDDTTTGSTTATEIPFGVLVPGEEYVLAQDMTVNTNARNGFIVTVEQDQDLLSSTGAVISPFQDGSYENISTAWAAPTGDVNDNETWGHWGLTSNDGSLETLYEDAGFDNNGYVAASTTPRLVFAHDDSAGGSEPDIGTARVGYKIEITALQEAAEDYTTTLTYIATPTF